MLPALYHAHHSLDADDLPFWLGLAKEQGRPFLGRPFLELGCGTGRVMGALMQAGYQVTGLDNDLDMLLYLHGQLPTAPVFQADMAAFHLARRFGLIIMPCNTYSCLSTQIRRATLRQVAEHLQPGGLFAASLPNPFLLMNLPERGQPEVEEVFPHPMTGNPVQVSSAWRRSKRSFSVRWTYDHLLPDGTVERLTMQVRHHLLSPGEYLQEIQAAGLVVQDLYGDYNRADFTTETPNLIFVTRKA